jgi:hypothetical protein
MTENKAPDTKAVAKLLGSVTGAAVKAKTSDVVERFVDADRNRIGETTDSDTYKGVKEQLQKDWKGKYNKDFDLDDAENIYPASMFTVMQGEIPKGAAGADVTTERKADGTVKVDVDAKSGVDKPGTPAADENKNDPGRDVAVVTLAAAGDMPEMKIPLIHEAGVAGGAWRIDVPDTLTGDKLQKNLQDHLTAVNKMKDKWPDNVNDAYAAVTRHVLMAIMDQPAKME